MMAQDSKIVSLLRDKILWQKTVLCLLGVVVWLGSLVLSVPIAEAKIASVGGTTSCATSGCHVVNTGLPVAQVAVKAGAASWATFNNALTAGPINGVPVGATIELEWVWTNLNDKKGNTGAAIAIPNTTPTAWTFTPNANVGAGALTLWNAAYQSTTWYGGATPTGLASNNPTTHIGYVTDYSTTSINNLNTAGLAIDDPGPDGAAAQMGAKVSVTIPADTPSGNYTIKVYGSGHVGNSRTSTITTITLGVVGAADAVKPTVDSFTATTPVATNVNIPVTAFTASDNVGVTGFMITANTTPPASGDAGWAGTAPTTYTSAAGDGTKTLYPWAKDAAGNVSNVYGSPASVLVDGTVPTTTDNSPAGWQGGDVTVTLTPNDAGSGVALTEYCIDTANTCTPGTAGTAVSVTQTAGTAGTQYVRYRSTDNAGNVETTKSSGAIDIDKLAPSTTDNAPAGWQAGDVTVTLTPSDSDSGLAATEYCVDTTNLCVPGTAGTSASVTQSAGTAGTQYVRYRSTDNVGNVETTQSSGAIEIDKKGPTDGALTVTPGNTQNSLSWTAASDADSGLRTGTIYDVRFLQSGTPPTCASGVSLYAGDLLTYSHTSLTNGLPYSYRVCAYDAVDNPSVGAAGSGTPAAGNSSPNVPTNLAQYKTDGSTVIVSNGYTNETIVKIEADISDPDGGDTVKLQVDIDGNGTSDCESTLAATPQTNVQVSCGVVDGNSYDWQVRTVDNSSAASSWVAFAGSPDFTVDTTAPSVTTTTPTDAGTGVALDGNVTINFTDGPIDCTTVDTGSVTSDNPGWAFSSCSGTQAVFTTSGQLNNTTYNVNVTTSVADEAGNALTAYPFSYTTASAANQAPTDITLSPNKVTDGTDTSGGFDMTLGAVDPDAGDTFTFTKTGVGADQALFSLTGTTLTLIDGVVSYDSPGDANADGVYEVEVQVEDSATNTFSKTMLVTITPAYNPMIHSSLSTGSSKWGGNWGTATGKYGEFTCGTCHERSSGNIKRIKTAVAAPNGSDTFPIELAAGTVSFQDARDGTSEFGDDSGGHASSNRICEACHSQNKYHNYDTTNNTAGFNHENQKDCISCHNHSKGFGASCDACHGNPPVSADTDGSTNTGLVHDPSATGATSPTSPGGHALHVVTEGMSCTTCHKGNTMPTVSMTIQMGFEVNNANWAGFGDTSTGGSLDVPQEANLTNTYKYVSGDGGTTSVVELNINNPTCSVYCHADWTGHGGQTTTSWVGGPAIVDDCNDCHGGSAATPPTAGSHQLHAGNGAGDLALACSKCHPSYSDAAHLDGDVAWALDTADSKFGASAAYGGSDSGATGGKAPSAAYGDCTNIYCHSPGTPTWGGVVNCGDCHNVGTSMASGDHTVHVNNGSLMSNAGCQDCHVSTSSDGSTVTGAALHVNEVNDVTINGIWDGDAIPDNDYLDGNCSDVYCHSNGQASWVAKTVAWGDSSTGCNFCHNSDTSMASGSHSSHVNDTANQVGWNVGCAECHSNTVSDNASISAAGNHLNISRDLGIAANGDQATCTDISCHSNGNFGGSTFSYQLDTDYQWGVDSLAGCDDCHGDGAGLSYPSYANGGIGEDSNSHATHISGPGYTCEECHSATATANNLKTGGTTQHVNQAIDVVGSQFTWTSGSETCSNITCHFNNSAQWGDTLGCADCHGNPPATNAHLLHAGSAAGEYGFACSTCHPVNHDGSTTDITFTGIAANWPGATYTSSSQTCDNLYCHGSATADWDGNTGGACGDCHGDTNGRPDGANEPAGGSHLTTSHQVVCTTCHSHDGTDTTEHVNGDAGHPTGDALVSSAGANVSSYTYGATLPSSPDPDGYKYSGGTCATNCHSDGVWGSTGGCTFCHGGSDLYYPQTSTAPDRIAEHAAHVYALETKLGYTHGTTNDAEQKIMCAYCHNDSNGVGGTGHNDGGDAEVGDFNPMWNGAVADVDGTLEAGKSCSSIDCHYNTTTADTWYGTGTADCVYCHAGDASYTAGALPHAHDKHVDENASSGYNMTCATCHDSSGYAQDHADGSSGSDVIFTGAVATAWGTESYVSAQKQCSNLYCHGSATADWDAGTGGACGNCHGDTSGRPDGIDEPSGGSHLTTSHQVACTNCHSHDGTDEIEHVNGDAGHTTGDALVSNAGSNITSYSYGSTLASSPDPDGYKYSGGTCATSCHGNQVWGGTATCDTCHNGTGSGYTKVGINSPHSSTATGMTCEDCHFAAHGSRTTGTVGITWFAQTMGTDYTADGKVYIKANGAANEAEACWACHESQTPDVSEWDGSSAVYDYGSVTTGDLNWFTTSWSSANFGYKSGTLSNAMGGSASTHGTNGGANGVDVSGEVSCTRCHDVHGIGNNGYTAGATPYLRGSWKSSAYYEDGAPGRYTGSGGSGTSTYINAGNYGVVPRASNSALNGMGGYWIDQNSGSPANGTYATHAGLCTLCHGDGDTNSGEAADVVAIEALWVGHKNTVAGGNDDGSSARNIFSTAIRIGDGVWNGLNGGPYMGAQNMVTYRNGGTKNWVGSIRTSDYPDGVSPKVVGKAFAYNNFAWGVNVDSSSVDSNYHSFSCSKCHNPHASRLPKLMITNCLDTSQNLWDDSFTGDGNWGNNNYSSMTYGTNELAKSSTAQNCHRYVSGQETSGWNSVTPW